MDYLIDLIFQSIVVLLIAVAKRKHAYSGDKIEIAFELPYNGIQPGFILISQRICRISAAEVHIFFAIYICDHCAAGMIDDNIITVICMDDILRVQFLDMAAVHQLLLSLL